MNGPETKGEDCVYPVSTPVGPEWGLTKREYFAALALQGMLAGPRDFRLDRLSIREAAELATDAADALIAALNAPKS